MTRRAVRLLLLAAVGSACACSESDLLDIPDEGDVAAEAVTAMLTPLFAGAASIPAQPALATGPQAVPFSYQTPIADSQSCGSGGQVVREGSAFVSGDDQTNEVSVLRSTTLQFQACAERSGGITVTISSSPSILGALAYTVDFEGETPTSLWGGLTNNPTIAAPGFEQECNVMVDFQSTAISASSVTLQVVEGSACGQDLTGETLVVPL